MKFFNIIDIEFLKAYLSKYYEDNNIEYEFFSLSRENIQDLIPAINEFEPVFILLQDKYSDFSGVDIINYIQSKNIEIEIGYLEINSSRKGIVLLDQKNVIDHSKIDRIPYNGADVLNHLKTIHKKIEKDLDEVEEARAKKNKILYIDDSNFMHKFIGDLLKDMDYDIIHAYDGVEGLELYNKHYPELIITDIEMPRMDGLELCKKIKYQNEERFIPVIVLSNRDEPVDINTAFDVGIDEYLTKPVDEVKLFQLIEGYMETPVTKTQSKILLVEHSKTVSEVIRHALLKQGINVITRYSGIDGMKALKEESPEVIIVDADIPEMAGYEFIKKIRENRRYSDISIIIITSQVDSKVFKKYRNLKISKMFKKPFDTERLVTVVEYALLEKYNMYKREIEYMLLTMKSLIRALEAKDPYTKGHTIRVSEYSVDLAKYMKLDKREIENIEVASNLHDIGKIGVKDNVLLKTGQLTDPEYKQIQKHAVMGAGILSPINSLKDAIPLVLYHHERWDGDGYPSMLKNKKIPIGARIIAVADAFDAMTTNRPYRKKISKEKALKIIEENSGTQFCPRVVDNFIKMMRSRIIEENNMQ
ncbi:MAG: response regulator [Fusobacteriota bacterium]